VIAEGESAPAEDALSELQVGVLERVTASRPGLSPPPSGSDGYVELVASSTGNSWCVPETVQRHHSRSTNVHARHHPYEITYRRRDQRFPLSGGSDDSSRLVDRSPSSALRTTSPPMDPDSHLQHPCGI
jgi:hypothetical protein